MQDSSTVSFCPSFSFYASVEFADAAVKIAGDSSSYTVPDDHYSVKIDGHLEEDVDFEFVAPKTMPSREDGLFFYPIQPHDGKGKQRDGGDVANAQDTSRNHLLGEWSTPSFSSPSLSSSESDDLENFPPSSYHCMWSPLRSPAAGSSLGGGGRSKSKFTGTPSRGPKWWRFKDLLRRSHSDGSEGTSVFPNGNDREKKMTSPAVNEKDKTASYKVTNVAQGDKRRKSYLPYRQDLIGVLVAMNRLCR